MTLCIACIVKIYNIKEEGECLTLPLDILDNIQGVANIRDYIFAKWSSSAKYHPAHTEATSMNQV